MNLHINSSNEVFVFITFSIAHTNMTKSWYNPTMGNFNGDSVLQDRRVSGFNRRRGGRGRFNRDGREDKRMFDAVCSNCGKNCQVPFKPTGNKPVYCDDCFGKMGNRSARRPCNRSRFSGDKHREDQYKAHFESVNAKLDKILSLLQPAPAPKPVPATGEIMEITEAPVEKIEKTEVKSTKPKKLAKKKASGKKSNLQAAQ
jgi:CxxC-x17-CxxC domain-containing protein